MTQISIEDIPKDFLILLQRVSSGESLIVMKGGKAIAEIKPIISDSSVLRPYGLCAGEFVVPDDFDSPLPDHILDDFEGRLSISS